MAIICFIVGVVAYFIGQQLSFIMSSIGSVFFCFIITGIIYYIAAKAPSQKAA